jgi:serine/threonine protein kinase
MQSDVYSFGILLWEMTARQVPFDGLPVSTIREKVLAGDRPPVGLSVNGKVAFLMRACWASEPSARPTMAKVVPAALPSSCVV